MDRCRQDTDLVDDKDITAAPLRAEALSSNPVDATSYGSTRTQQLAHTGTLLTPTSEQRGRVEIKSNSSGGFGRQFGQLVRGPVTAIASVIPKGSVESEDKFGGI